MELLPVVLASGWASGINAYLVVLVLGLIGRFGQVAEIPLGLTRTDVLVVAAILYLVELVADKIPYFDSLWDAVSTAIRPTVGAVIGLLMAQDAPTLQTAVLAASGGAAALISHLVKGGLRLIVNTSPEPASNITVSVVTPAWRWRSPHCCSSRASCCSCCCGRGCCAAGGGSAPGGPAASPSSNRRTPRPRRTARGPPP